MKPTTPTPTPTPTPIKLEPSISPAQGSPFRVPYEPRAQGSRGGCPWAPMGR